MRNYFQNIATLTKNLENQISFEEVIKLITKFSYDNLGNRSNAMIEGNLKKGEKNLFACGSFIMINDDKQILIGPQNYAPEQEYMLLDTNIGHPSWVIKNKNQINQYRGCTRCQGKVSNCSFMSLIFHHTGVHLCNNNVRFKIISLLEAEFQRFYCNQPPSHETQIA